MSPETIAHPTTLIGLISVIVMVAGGLGAIWLQNRNILNQNKESGKTVHEVHEQVKNTHASNMREDIDEANRICKATQVTVQLMDVKLSEMLALVTSHGGDISGIRKDFGAFRSEVRKELVSMREELHREAQTRIDEDRKIADKLRRG